MKIKDGIRRLRWGLMFLPTLLTAQQEDSFYREDQFYAGITYNYLINRPKDLEQRGFSKGFQVGFLRDMPISSSGKVALALGLGYAYDNAFFNLLALPKDGQTTYHLSDSGKDGFSSMGFQLHSLELPLEFRYRTSTPNSHKFYRIYSGAKIAYVISSESFYHQQDLEVFFKNNEITSPWQAKFYLSAGYNTWNIFVQYVFTPFFKDKQTTEGVALSMNLLQMGLMFYIL